LLEIASGLTVNLYLLTAMGAAVGLVAGFAGVAGGYLLTPILIVMGLPAPLAVGTALALIAGNNLIGVLRHRELGHIDLKMGLITAAGTLLGTEIGIRLLHLLDGFGERAADIAVLGTLLLTLTIVSVSMLRDVLASTALLNCDVELAADEDEIKTTACRFLQSLSVFPHIRFTKSKLRISGWIVLGLGMFIGILSGALGVGGGFMLSPALMYLVGQSSMMAVGTNLLGVLVGVTFGCFRHAMLGNVQIAVALTMLLGTSVGTFIGARGTAHVRGLAVRYVLATSVVTALLGPALKMVHFFIGSDTINQMAKLVTVAQVFIPVGLVILLLVYIARHRSGRDVPLWARRLMPNGQNGTAG
jgi:uncharacterized membrane protein YfcA